MESTISLFQEFINKYQIENNEKKFIACMKKYEFLYASEKLNLNELPLIQKKLQQTKTLIIKKYENKNQSQAYYGYILSFEQTIIIIDNLSDGLFNELLLSNPKLSFLYDQGNIINVTEGKKINMIIPHKKLKYYQNPLI